MLIETATIEKEKSTALCGVPPPPPDDEYETAVEQADLVTTPGDAVVDPVPPPAPAAASTTAATSLPPPLMVGGAAAPTRPAPAPSRRSHSNGRTGYVGDGVGGWFSAVLDALDAVTAPTETPMTYDMAVQRPPPDLQYSWLTHS